MKQIVISKHAHRRMSRRGIGEEQIYETVRSPDQLVQGYRGRKIAQKKYRRKGKEYLLRAVLEEHFEETQVITVYITSKIDRYWKDGDNEN